MKNLTFALLASITGLLVFSRSGSLMNTTTYAGADCLQITEVQVGHAYPTWDYYANNVCNTPKIFTIKYQFFQEAPEVFVSECLAQNGSEDTPLILPYTTVLSTSQINC